MTMREDCRFFQNRVYPSGDVARFCVLDLAPEAPWRCPEGCRRYERRVGDVSFTGDSLVQPASGPEPELGSGVAALLDSAEDIINTVGPEIVAEQRRRDQEVQARQAVWWRKLRRTPPWRR